MAGGVRRATPSVEEFPQSKAPRRARQSKGAGSKAAARRRCDGPLDSAACARGAAAGRSEHALRGCDRCCVTFERHIQQDMPRQDCDERCRADPSFNEDFEKHIEAGRQLAEALSPAQSENGSVEVDVFYGREVSKVSVQLTQQQWNEKENPPGIAGITPEFAKVEETRAPSSTQPGASSTGPCTDIQNYSRTEVKMSTIKIHASQVAKAGGNMEVFRKEIAKEKDRAFEKARDAGLVQMDARPSGPPLQMAALAGASVNSDRSGGAAADAGALAEASRHAAARVQAVSSGGGGRGASAASALASPAPSLPMAGPASAPPIRRRPTRVLTDMGSPPGPARSVAGARDRSRSPAMSLPNLIGTQGRRTTPKAAGSAAVHNMQRDEAMKEDVVISQILDGLPNWDKVYSLKRFKPTSPSIAIMAENLCKKADAASTLVTDMCHKGRGQISTHFGDLSHEDALESFSFSTDLLSKYLKLADPPVDAIAEALMPWDPNAGAFSMFEPTLASVTGDIDSKITVSREILLDCVVLPALAGSSKIEYLRDFGRSLVKVFSRVKPTQSTGVKEYYRIVKGVGLLLHHLPNMDPRKALQETIARMTKTLVEQDPEVVDASIMDTMEKHMQRYSEIANFALGQEGCKLGSAYNDLLKRRSDVEGERKESALIIAAKAYNDRPDDATLSLLTTTIDSNKAARCETTPACEELAKAACQLVNKIPVLMVADVGAVLQRGDMGELFYQSFDRYRVATLLKDAIGGSLETSTEDAFDQFESAVMVLPSMNSHGQDELLRKYGGDIFEEFSRKVAGCVPTAEKAMACYKTMARDTAFLDADQTALTTWTDTIGSDDFSELDSHLKATLYKQFGIANRIKGRLKTLTVKKATFHMACAAVKDQTANSGHVVQRNIDAMTARGASVDDIPKAFWTEDMQLINNDMLALLDDEGWTSQKEANNIHVWTKPEPGTDTVSVRIAGVQEGPFAEYCAIGKEVALYKDRGGTGCGA
ncbi:unnamed protein product [Prorocentrum cordatum]|uniref:Uncharacterized protein n=1 Tax=Prorocentrum cordatum TaxID=2364126 RepID=A0ABN9SPW2_9DINO|nr:unnamed protein product [Polarella glacialis]